MSEYVEEPMIREEKVLLHATLCFPIRGDAVLLGMKMRKIGQGCWNGYGGGIEPGETPEQSIVRELQEESSVQAFPNALEKAAIIDFHNTTTDGTVFVCRVHIFLLRRWDGEFQPTNEMGTPTWFKIQTLPLDGMMPADKEWLPPILAGKKVLGRATYGPFQKELLEPVQLQIVASLA